MYKITKYAAVSRQRIRTQVSGDVRFVLACEGHGDVSSVSLRRIRGKKEEYATRQVGEWFGPCVAPQKQTFGQTHRVGFIQHDARA